MVSKSIFINYDFNNNRIVNVSLKPETHQESPKTEGLIEIYEGKIYYSVNGDSGLEWRVLDAKELQGVTDKIEQAKKAVQIVLEDKGDLTATNVQDAIKELNEKIKSNKLVVKKFGRVKKDYIRADGTDYDLMVGEERIATINIARDMVVKSGEVIIATGQEKLGVDNSSESASLTAGKHYIKLELNNAEDTKNYLYIPAESLITQYSGKPDGIVPIAISSSGEISATIHNHTITYELLENQIESDIKNSYSAIEEGSENGTISVKKLSDPSSSPVKVHGLKDAAYKSVEDLKQDLLGTTDKTASQLIDEKIAEKTSTAANYFSQEFSFSGDSITITSSQHQCGNYPLVQVYKDQELIQLGISVNSGTVMITKDSGSIDKVRVVLIGK